jgi:hypothetical protein
MILSKEADRDMLKTYNYVLPRKMELSSSVLLKLVSAMLFKT